MNETAMKYPETIMDAIRQGMYLEKGDSSQDGRIELMSSDEAFDRVCNWHGFIDWGSNIRSWVRDIYGVKFSK